MNSTTCGQTCPHGQYIDDTNSPHICLSCDISCARCTTTSTTCTFCTNILNIMTVYLEAGECLKTCPDGQYPFISNSATVTNECIDCTLGCTKCTALGLTYCSACGDDGVDDYYLAINSTTCGKTCPNGQFLGTVASHLCIACDISCQTCTVNSTNCGTCNTGFVKNTTDQTCMSACQVGYYSDGTNCVICDLACASCYGPLKT